LGDIGRGNFDMKTDQTITKGKQGPSKDYNGIQVMARTTTNTRLRTPGNKGTISLVGEKKKFQVDNYQGSKTEGPGVRWMF